MSCSVLARSLWNVHSLTGRQAKVRSWKLRSWEMSSGSLEERKGEGVRDGGREGDQLAMARELCTVVLGVFLGFGKHSHAYRDKKGTEVKERTSCGDRKPRNQNQGNQKDARERKCGV